MATKVKEDYKGTSYLYGLDPKTLRELNYLDALKQKELSGLVLLGNLVKDLKTLKDPYEISKIDFRITKVSKALEWVADRIKETEE